MPDPLPWGTKLRAWPPLKRTVSVPTLGFEPTRHAWPVPALGSRPVLVKVTVNGPKWISRFETFLAPGASPFEVVSTRVAYRVPRPAKVKRYHFPKTPPPLPKTLAVLYFEGINASAYRVEQAVATVKHATVRHSYYTSNVYGNRLDYVPASVEELFGYSAVVVGNVDIEAIGTDLTAYLDYYVRHGGTVLVLGGMYAFGHGQYKGSSFDRLLPVASGTTFDVARADRPLTLVPDPGASWLTGLAWTDGPAVRWRHVPASVRPGARIVVRAGDAPFLVEHRIGRGRVWVVLGAALGTGEGHTPFWQWKDWPRLLARLFERRG